ncbi:MAG: hypothetical protein ACUVYA_07710 [Planctomycetota bacterium]
MSIAFENQFVRYVVGADGTHQHFIDRQTGTDYAVSEPPSPCAHVRQAGQEFLASAAFYEDGRLTVEFGDSGVQAVIGVTVEKHYLALEVLSVAGEGVEVLTFVDLALQGPGTLEAPFVGCALALNLQTNVPELPGPNRRLRAMCYPRFGMAGARVALIGCPPGQLREVMKEVVTAAPEVPHSPLGGPWALDAPINRSSYLFMVPNEANVEDCIRTLQSVGFNQVQIHGGGGTYRFGDCEPNRTTYPNGRESLKATIARLHQAGIYVGMHPYAFFIDKSCSWVTPVPDPRLAKDATFTLAVELSADDATVPVVESTEAMSTITGFFVRNSVTLQIEDELITYAGLSKHPPFAFTSCTRGAYGTKAAPHPAGMPVYHLKECFGLFAPDPETTLLEEVAQKNAEFFNECDFDTLYLDALDGEDVLGGVENGWHYGSKYVWLLWKHLKKPAAFEYSTFHHHLWYLRSRHGAWDHPTRCYKQFIDLHVQSNRSNDRMFLPSNLGWWAFKSWAPPQEEPTFPEDIEYWCAKALGTESGLSLQGYTPGQPSHQRLAAIVKQYETLRHAGYFPEAIKAQLRVPGAEFTLFQNPEGTWGFRPARYARHKVQGVDGWSNAWKVENPFGQQPVQFRIEALMSAGPYDAPDNVMVADFTDPTAFSDRASAPGITADLQSSFAQLKEGPVSGCFTATNSRAGREGTWAKVGRAFAPPLDLRAHPALGVWVYGDGQGEVLNIQLQSPSHLVGGIGEHYVTVDFIGWRYFELIEPDADRYTDYVWPYGGGYAIYREGVLYSQVETVNLWYNHLPAGEQVTCYLSPIKALPLVPGKLRHPRITVGDQTILFPVEIESGCYLEFRSPSDCKLYGPQGEPLAEVEPQGNVPLLETGPNPVQFHAETLAGLSARAYVILISHGEPLN